MRTGDFIATEFSGDSTGLVNSIAYIGAVGGLVQICSGSFTGLPSISGVSKITIQGAGTGQTILKLANNVDASMFDFSSKNDICIRDLQIDGNKANNAGTTTMGIRALSCTRVRFENVYAHDCEFDGFYVSGCTDVTFDSCISENNDRNGFSCGDAAAATSDRVNFYACTSKGHSGSLDIGFSLESASNATIHGCRSIGDYRGITALGTTLTPLNNVTIEGNKIIDFTTSGIFIGDGGNPGAKNVKVVNNELKPASSAVEGITASSMSDFEIIGNTIEPFDPTGTATAIVMTGSTSVAISTTANGTTTLTRSGGNFTSDGVRPGDYITGGSPAPTPGAFVVSVDSATSLTMSNTLAAGSEPQSRTFTRPVQRFIVANNRIDSPGGYGINASFCKLGTISGNVLRNCAMSGGSRDGMRFDGAGLCTEIAITGNTIYDDKATPTCNYAINGNVGGTALAMDRCTIMGNIFRNMVQAAVINLGNNLNRVIGNTGLPRPSQASTATITLPAYGEVVEITGNTPNITGGVVASWPGRVVTLVFTGTPTLNNGGNMNLIGTFVATAKDTLTIFCDGTNWFEIARSPNV